MAPLPMTLNNLERHFAVWNLSNFHTSGNIVCTIYDMFNINRKAYVDCNFNCLFTMKDFWRSHAVKYALNVVVSRKRCKMKSLWLQTNKVSHTLQACLNVIFFHTVAQRLTRFQVTVRRAVTSAIGQLVVEICERIYNEADIQTSWSQYFAPYLGAGQVMIAGVQLEATLDRRLARGL